MSRKRISRQIYSVERFKPYSAALEAIDSRLSAEEKEVIASAATITQDWLDVIQRLIDLTMLGITSPEEILIEANKNRSCLFGSEGTTEMVTLLSDVWYNHCFVEMSKYANQIRKKAMEISEISSKHELIDYILGLSDRIEKAENNTIKFNVKPDMSVKVEDIENIIVMPSVFSSRNITFWYSGSTFLFYVGLDSKAMSMEEPSDMLLLKTLAFNDRTRLKMLKTLAFSAMSVNKMAEIMKVNASTVSRHFKVFKDAGFVDIQSQEGNSIYYSINENEVKKAMETIYNYIFRRNKE
ncbi:MAG: Bacterial regulatory protein arsR family [Clostridiales bacterium]|nr:Bacterial regulatory protein arsR family [Clostridiales bacterium]